MKLWMDNLTFENFDLRIKSLIMEGIKNWLKDSANILFDDSKNDLRALPKTVRLQILLVLSFIWSTVFSLYIFSYTTFAFGVGWNFYCTYWFNFCGLLYI